MSKRSPGSPDTLLISPDGMLGRAFVELFTKRGLALESVTYPAFDITDADHVARAVHSGIQRVLNCSAYTDVDAAEAHEADAIAVNASGVQLLAQRCRSTGALLVHYSTDYVFDGDARSPYRVNEPRKPQNAYGRSKARGEELLIAAGCQHLVIRTSWLYAPWGKNFVDTIAKLGHERPMLRVVHDQHGRPTSAQYLAERSLALIEHGSRGIFHVTDGGQCTWFEFARAIVQRTGGKVALEPCTTADFPRPARRPAYSVLDLTETESRLGSSRPWQENLAAVLDQRAALALGT
jgi:dTDP-4-dehydrorhamnose reductase